MLKKVFYLVVTSSIISAGLLYLGIALMSHFTPAHASSLDALVAETNLQKSTDPTVYSNSSAKASNDSENPLAISQSTNIASSPMVVSDQSSKVLMVKNNSATSVSSVTIAELIKNPKQYADVVFTITGIATVLNDEKFLLNDGTGQILVEVEDEMISLAVINGISITVIGELDDTDSPMALELDACSLSYQNENIVFDDCIDDDGDDDLNDDDDMDDDDDSEDDDDDDGMEDDDEDLDDDSDESDDAEDDIDNPGDDD